MNKFYRQPYRLFFLIGAIFAVSGVMPWLLQLLPNATYPLDFHRLIMIDGFVLSFVLAFLTFGKQSELNHKKWQVNLLVVLLIISGFFTFIKHYPAHYLSTAVLILTSLTIFHARLRKSPWIYSGLLSWLISTAAFSLIYSGNIFLLDWSGVLADLFAMGSITAIGIGAALEKHSLDSKISYVSLGLFFLSHLLPKFIPLNFCLYLRAAVILFLAFAHWQIYRPPVKRTRLNWGYWFSGWCLVLGYLLLIFWQEQFIHAMHAILIGGFSLSIFLISTQLLKKSETSRRLVWITSFTITATATRLFAPIIPQIYLRHLAYSAFLWFVGFGIWVWLTGLGLSDN